MGNTKYTLFASNLYNSIVHCFCDVKFTTDHIQCRYPIVSKSKLHVELPKISFTIPYIDIPLSGVVFFSIDVAVTVANNFYPTTIYYTFESDIKGLSDP